jgi:segregation and condensation protein B
MIPRTNMPETTVDDPMKGATLEDLVAALGPRRGNGAPAIEIADEDDDPEADPGPDLVLAGAGAGAGVVLEDELPMDVDDDLSAVEGKASPRLTSIVESLLFAATEPLTVKKIRKLLKDPSKEQIQLALKKLSSDSHSRGIVLHQVAGGFRLRTNPENAQFVQRMLTARPVRLSRSQLEALAVIAYRQPVTKAEVDHVRGVDCGAVLRLLLERNLIKIVGRKEEPGRPHLYGTTVSFLELFNLKSLRDMPDLHEFRELNEESEAVIRERLGSMSALADEQEALGQEVIHFESGSDPEEAESSSEPEEAEEAEAPEPEELAAETDPESGPESGLEPEPEAEDE